MQPPSSDPVDPDLPMSPLVYRTPAEPPGELPVLSNRAMAWAAVVLIVLGVGLAAGLLVALGNGQHSGQLDAIKTAGTIVLGTGGAAALWLTARRQRTSELGLNQVRAAHAATVADAEARRITDLYGKAADQLGSTQAPVRLAGLYALERLAQDNPDQRQTIVDLLCAYLRMPCEPPPRVPVRLPAARSSGVSRPLLGSAGRQRASVRLAPPAPHADTPTGAATQAQQEYQVRRTAQAILFRHLRFGTQEKPVDTFWSGINLDLTGALLGPTNLIGCRMHAADFTGATFIGDVWFHQARFGLGAGFTGVRFAGKASFSGARFDHDARFDGARFAGEASFSGARFDHDARFDGARFHSYAQFNDADFHRTTKFGHAEFRSGAVFDAATFADDAWFNHVRFEGQTDFNKARFAGRGMFNRAHFAKDGDFNGAEFDEDAHFYEARFTGAYTQFCHATLTRADFRAAEFGLNANFTETRFTGDATFWATTFTGHVDFIRATFDSRVNFDGTRFARSATFEDAEFDGNARFHDCHFSQSTEFERTRFGADVEFEETAFGEGAGFLKATFGGRAQFTLTSFDGVTGFPESRFDGDTILDHVHFGGPVGFTRSNFARPPRIRAVWVRLDGPRPLDVDSTWPPSTVTRETGQRPHGVDEGRWALLVSAASDEANTAQELG